MKDIKLSNRYGYALYLHPTEEKDHYLLIGDEDALSCVGVTFDKSPINVIAIDPSGGPYIAVGSKIAGKVVKSITSSKKGFIIELCEK